MDISPVDEDFSISDDETPNANESQMSHEDHIIADFSVAGLILAGHRYSLSSENLENEVVIKSNLKLLKKCSID